jgi:hypothetical protein
MALFQISDQGGFGPVMSPNPACAVATLKAGATATVVSNFLMLASYS